MASRPATLETAEFLDSEHAKALEIPQDDVRRIAQAFLEVCYEDVGKKPRLMDAGDAHAALGHCLPGRMKRGDPLAAHVPDVLRAFVAHLEEVEIVPHVFELRRGLEATFGEFQEAVRTGREAHHGHQHGRQDPFVHGAAKLGRNDPCSCGSGKKYKKCHGREA